MFRRIDFLLAGPLLGVSAADELDRAEVTYLGDRCGVFSKKLYESQPTGRVYFRCRVRWGSVRVYMLRASQIDESGGAVRLRQPMIEITASISPEDVDRICTQLYYYGGYGSGRFLDETGHREGEL